MSQPPISAHNDIRGVLIQTAGGRLLLPNASIAEVLSYAQPDPVEGAPSWLLGRMRWHGWQLPLVAFADMAGLARENAQLGAKVVVLKAMGGNPRAPYFALLTQGFPRLVTVAADSLTAEADQEALPLGVQARVRLNEDAALLPDLEGIEHQINQVLATAA